MNFKKAVAGFNNTKGKTYTVQDTLSIPDRWTSCWALYSFGSEEDYEALYDNYDQWMKWVDYIHSKPE